MTAPLLSVRDLSVAFGHGERRVLAVDRVSFDIAKGETVALSANSGSGKSVTALSVMQLLPYPAASHPSGSILFEGQDLLTLSDREMRRVRGDDITIIFQEPMTSLNPLHTIEKQIGEILLLHRACPDAPRATASSNCSPRSAFPIRRAGSELSAPAVRRPAPARDDRDGARQRAGPADRRRADHRARRHGAGADPEAAEGYPGAARHGDAVHHPRPRHRAQDRRPGLRHEPRQDRRARPCRARVHGTRASLYAGAARRRAQARPGAAAA